LQHKDNRIAVYFFSANNNKTKDLKKKEGRWTKVTAVRIKMGRHWSSV
jgi:hypothetical protein